MDNHDDEGPEDLGEDLRDARFFEMVDLGELPPTGSLEAASGLRSRQRPYETDLIEEGETAWRTPYRDLTCRQVSTLVSQKAGLEWLGRPAIDFAYRYPLAEIKYYPGEIGVFCLRAAPELARFAQPEFGHWLSSDFGWIEQAFAWSRQNLREVRAELEAARAVLGAQ